MITGVRIWYSMGGIQSDSCLKVCPWRRANRDRFPPKHCHSEGKTQPAGNQQYIRFWVWFLRLVWFFSWLLIQPLYHLLLQTSSEGGSSEKWWDCDSTDSSLVGTGQVVSQDEYAKPPYAAVLVRDINCLWWFDLSWLSPWSHSITPSLAEEWRENII